MVEFYILFYFPASLSVLLFISLTIGIKEVTEFSSLAESIAFFIVLGPLLIPVIIAEIREERIQVLNVYRQPEVLD